MSWFGAAIVSVLTACSAAAVSDPTEETDEELGGAFKPGCVAKKESAYALGGTLLLPTGPAQGYVVVQDEKIVSVLATKSQVPTGIPVVETGGIVSPGFMDLHNHVAYNFLPLWNSGKRFQNRYQWSGIQAYGPAVKEPYNAVKNAGHQCEGVKYGEFRALVGGTTTIQGSVDLGCTRSWVRNVEFVNFCQDHIRQNVLPINGISPEDAATLNAQFASGATKTFFVHLAEGIDDKSRQEFEQLRGLGLLKPQVVGIHSTALNAAQIAEMGKIGMKIVWSPLSNLILYGHTTNIPAAVKAGITIALAPDWSPSGSANVLGELKVADRVNKERFNHLLTDRQLVEMATINAAKIAAMDDRLGKIAPGYNADLVVIRKQSNRVDPYRAVIDARPQDVLLTTVDGEAFYGDPKVLSGIKATRAFTTVDACGESRSLAVTEPNTQIPHGTESLQQIQQTFASDGVANVIGMFQCTAAPEWAFAGTTQGAP